MIFADDKLIGGCGIDPREEGAELMRLTASGGVFRFLLTPLSSTVTANGSFQFVVALPSLFNGDPLPSTPRNISTNTPPSSPRRSPSSGAGVDRSTTAKTALGSRAGTL